MSENTAPVETPAINSAVPEIAIQEAEVKAGALAPDAAAANERVASRTASRAEREAHKADLLAKLAASKATPEEKTEEPKAPKTDEPKTEAKVEAKTETETKPDRSVATIAKQSQELRDLKAKLATYEGKATVETKDEFLAKVKADPSLLFKEVGDDDLLTKLADARYKELTPEEKLKADVDAKLASYEKKIADAETEKKTAAEQANENTAHGAFSKILTEGFKSEDGSIAIDVSNYKLCQKLTKAGEVDAPRQAMNIVKGLSTDLGRKPNEAETATMIAIAYDALEETFRKKAEAYRLDAAESEEPPKTKTDTRAKDQKPTTINSRMASGGRVSAAPAKPVTRAEREAHKAEIMRKYELQRRQEARA